MVQRLEPIFIHHGSALKSIVISSGSSFGDILFWTEERGIVKYNMDGKKILQNWPVPTSVTVTSLAEDKSGTYSCIFNNKSLCRWTNEHLNPMKGKIYEFSRELIHKHHPVALDRQEFVCVTSEGDVLLSPSTETSEVLMPLKDLSCRLIFSDLLESPSEKTLVSITSKEPQKYSMRLHPINRKKGGLQEVLLTAKEEVLFGLSTEGRSIISCCLLGSLLKLVVLDDQGSLYQGNLERAVHGSRVETFSMVHFHDLFRREQDGKNSKVSAKLVPIGSHHFAAIHGCAERSNTIQISVCSSQFWTVTTEYEFGLRTNDSQESALEILSAEYCGGYIIIGTPYAVLACPISQSKPSLASITGRAQKRAFKSLASPDQPYILPAGKNTKTMLVNEEGKKQDEGLAYLQKIVSSTECKGKEEFERSLQSFISSFEGSHDRDKGNYPLETTESGLKKKRRLPIKRPSFAIPQNLLERITDRLLTEESIWSEQSIENLIRKGLISASCQIGLVQKLISKNSQKLLTVFFTSSRGVGEDAVIAGLRFALQSEIKRQKSLCGGRKAADSTDLCPPLDFNSTGDGKDNMISLLDDPEITRKPFCIQHHTSLANTIHKKYHNGYISTTHSLPKEVQNLLCSILSTTTDESIIEEKLQEIDLEEVQVLLDFLECQAVRLYLFSKRYQEKRYYQDRGLTHDQVIEWVSRVVNAKFTSLVMSPKITRTLSRLQFNIRQELRTEHCIKCLQPYFAQLQEKKGLPNYKDRQPYQLRDIFL